MRELFMAVLSLSLSGTLIGLMIVATHSITGKYFSKRWNYYIWLLVIVRLIVPFHFFPALSGGLNWQLHFERPTTDIAGISNQTTTVSVDTPNTSDLIQHSTEEYDRNNAWTALYEKDITDTKHEKTSNAKLSSAVFSNTEFSVRALLSIAAYIWFFGAAIALFARILNYCMFKSRIKKECVRVSDNRITAMENALCAKLHIENPPPIYENTAVSSPMTIGLWNFVIIIPKVFSDMDMTQLQLILHHELIHVARKDLLYKWTYQLLLCIHWFNPILHRICRQINRDCELSCDEAILTKLTDAGKQMYGNILIDTAALGIDCKENMLSTTLLDNKTDLKKRLDSILHHKKVSRFQLALSACVLIIMLTISACSTVWISSGDASVSESGRNDSTNVKTVDSDDSGLFMTLLTSFVSVESYLDHFGNPDRSSDAWKVYEDDVLLTGEDIQDNWGAYNYCGGNNKITASGFVLYGSDSFLVAYAEKEVNVKIQTSFTLSEGSFKIVYVAPDKCTLTLNDTGTATTQVITMQKGRNVLKMVGQGAKLKNLKIDYTDLKKTKFEEIYYSEDEEYVDQVKNAVTAGEPFSKDKVINALCYMNAKDASDVFNALLTSGTKLTDDELCDFFVYSDTTLSSKYLLEAIKAGNIEPPSADAISEIVPYLTGDCLAELLKSLPVEEFYEIFAESIYYLNSHQIRECLMDYMYRGGVLTSSMYAELYPYLDQQTIREFNKILPEHPGLTDFPDLPSLLNLP